jgi:galactokinase
MSLKKPRNIEPPPGPKESDVQHAQRVFWAHYGRVPRWVASAPGRVNLIGEFTDFNGGFVLPMAIERRTTIAAAPNQSRRIVLRSEQDAELITLDLGQPLTPGAAGSWGNYPIGVVAGFQRLGATVPGFDAHISSTVPVGAGLSSSAALAVATATLLEAVCNMALDPVAKALLCQATEHEFARVPCGIMDPYISSLGRADQVLLLDCESNRPEWVSLLDPTIAVLIVNTNVKHELAMGAYAQRRAACEAAARTLGVAHLRAATLAGLAQVADTLEDQAMRCARHVISENSRTVAAAECMREGRWEPLGTLMYESHESLRTDYAVSCPELDLIVATARKIGVQGGMFGCRMTGGGFGGCAVAIVRGRAIETIGEQIGAAYAQTFGAMPTILISRPAAGAHLEELPG